MKKLYLLFTVLFLFGVMPFYCLPMMVNDLLRPPETWGDDWRHDPRLFMPLLGFTLAVGSWWAVKAWQFWRKVRDLGRTMTLREMREGLRDNRASVGEGAGIDDIVRAVVGRGVDALAHKWADPAPAHIRHAFRVCAQDAIEGAVRRAFALYQGQTEAPKPSVNVVVVGVVPDLVPTAPHAPVIEARGAGQLEYRQRGA